MATWKGEAWLGSESGRQTVTVKSNTWQGAKQQIAQIYGEEAANNCWNIREVRDESDSSGSNIGVGSSFALIAVLVAIWVIVEYWWIVVPVAAICPILYIISRFR